MSSKILNFNYKVETFKVMADTFFVFALCCIIFLSVIERVTFIANSVLVSERFFIVFYFLMLPRLFILRFSYNKIILIIIIIMIILISTYNSQNYVFLRAIVIAFCGMDFDFYKIIKIIFILKIAATLFVLLMYGFGLTTTFSEEFRQFSETWGLFRNSFGFYHPNQTGIQIFSICAMLICLRYEVLNIKDYIFILGLCLLNFFFIGSRTSLFMCIILLVATDLCKRNKGKVFKNKAFKFILTSFPFIMVLILFLQIFILPKYEIFSFLNLTTSGRLYNNILAYHNIPISFLGSKVIFWDFNLVMDNDYMYSLIVRGVLPTAIMMALYSSMLSKLLKSGRFILVVIAVCFLIYGYSENISFHIQHNFALIWLLSDSRIFDFDSDSNTKNEKLIGAA